MKMKKLFNAFLIIVATGIALATAGCNFPGSSSDDDDDDYPDYPDNPDYCYVSSGYFNHISGQNWEVQLDYQADAEVIDLGVKVMRDSEELRRVSANRPEGGYSTVGQTMLVFGWNKGEEGSKLIPYVATSAGVTEGWEINLPFGVVINSMRIELTGDFAFDVVLDMFCDCNIPDQMSKLALYDQNNKEVFNSWIWSMGFDGKEMRYPLSGMPIMPNTTYRAVMTVGTEFNSDSAECQFTTPSRKPNQGDNNPPQQ